MKLHALFTALFLGCLASAAIAQTFNREQLLTQNNNSIFPNQQGFVTPQSLNGLFTNVIQGVGILNDQNVWTGQNTFVGAITPGVFTIATLPTCNASSRGARSTVTNGQTSPTFLGAVSTTGSVTAPVFCNGSGWVYG